MASSAEQLASQMSLGAFGKATELKKRIWFTLAALVVYRLGTYIPLPGIDPVALQEIFKQNAGGIIGMFDMFSGGALGRMSIFALHVMPCISAAILMQLMKLSCLKMMVPAGGLRETCQWRLTMVSSFLLVVLFVLTV